ncbi:MAG TPA: DUF4230 domain-containing protein [Polyangiaceae bacterium]|jgi:hypothetical protein
MRFWVLVVVGIVIAGLGLGFVAARLSANRDIAEDATTAVKPGPSVIVAVHHLARLEGARYDLERVIELTDEQSHLFGFIKSKDAILVVASGSVVAGVNLAQLADSDVVVNSKAGKVQMRLPHSKVLSSRIDNERTYVYRRSTDWLAERKEGLEARARLEAERSIVKAALDGEILQRSDASVKRTIESLVRSLGYQDVQIEFVGQ